MSTAELIDSSKASAVPNHIAIIMDGNGRWAKSRNLPRVEGHKAGALSVRKTVEQCRKLGVRYLTLFSFSTENWNRNKEEVTSLMELFKQYLGSELPTLLENGVRLHAIGDLNRLPFAVRSALRRDIEKTKDNDDLHLILAISYGGREEIIAAARQIAEKVARGEMSPEEVSNNSFRSNMWSADLPDPDLLIRTSGEERISNFLLWQLAYSEIIVVPELWPEFSEEVFLNCLKEYSARERRFGLTSEQIKSASAVKLA